MKLDSVLIRKIDLKDDRFLISPFVDYQSLLPSIRELGLISPPVVKESSGRLILVSGWKRVLACQALGMAEIPAFIATEDASDLQLFLRACEENLSSRSLSLAEKAEMINKLVHLGLDEEKVITTYLPRLSLPARPSSLDLLCRVARSGDPSLKKFLQEKDLSLEALEIFLAFSPEEREALFPYLRTLSLSRRRELILYFHEIFVREKLSVRDILNLSEVEAIFKQENLSPRERAERLTDFLRKRRYPLISYWEKEFQKSLREMGWPEEIRVSPDPSFEDDHLTVSFSFRSREEFLARLRQLEEIAQRPVFSRLFRRSL